jgi:hypothetical protein
MVRSIFVILLSVGFCITLSTDAFSAELNMPLPAPVLTTQNRLDRFRRLSSQADVLGHSRRF